MDDCHNYLGPYTYKPKEKTLDAQLITTSLASVRKNVGGVAVRVFVDLPNNKVCFCSNDDVGLCRLEDDKLIFLYSVLQPWVP